MHLIVKKRCTLLRHESCLQSWSHDEPKTTPTFCAQELIRTRLHCYHAYSIVTSVGFQKSCCEWLRFAFDQNLWKLNSSAIIFERFSVHIENSLFHRGDLNNNDNIGFPFFGGYKEILELDVTILDSSSTRPIQLDLGYPAISYPDISIIRPWSCSIYAV